MEVADRADGPAARQSRLLDYLRLFRAPNVFTAIADVTMGYLFIHGEFAEPAAFALLAGASSLMYTAGMVLNDVFDIEVDRVERPQRPLPSGRIALGTARALGYCLLVAGVAAAVMAGPLAAAADWVWRPAAVAIVLAMAIVAYDAVLKKTLLAPAAMGACRLLNVLLGMSIAPPAVAGQLEAAAGGESPPLAIGYSTAALVTAFGIGVYVAGVTILARGEAATSRRGPLLAGLGVMGAGVALLALGPTLDRPPVNPLWLAVLAVVAFTIARRCLTAVASPGPRQVQAAVKLAILSLIPLNAAVCAARADSVLALGLALLLVPAFLLGRWVYST